MKILFIGNSYTYYNDMPRIFLDLAQENGYDIEVDAVTRGGRKLYENLNAEDDNHKAILTLSEKKKYDVLFLQENSTLPIKSYSDFERGALGLVDLVKPLRTVLYVTWARAEGSPMLSELNMKRNEMSANIQSAYSTVARKLGAEISNVGACFDKIYESKSAPDLYDPDLSHPSQRGSELAAIAHFKKVFGRMPEKYSSLSVGADELIILADTVNNLIY